MSEKEEKTKKVEKESSERRRSSKESSGKKEKDGVFKVVVRNMFLMLVYRRLVFLTFMSFLAAGVSMLSFFMLSGKQVPPQYVPVMEDGRLLPILPLSKPNVDDGAIGEFALKAVRKMSNYDYLNWKVQLPEAQEYFTHKGWVDYFDAFQKTQIINTVEAGKMIVVAHPTGEVNIVNRGTLSNGTYVWRVEIPLEIRYINHEENKQQNLSALKLKGKMTLYIERVPNITSPKGIAVSRALFESDN